MGRRILRYSLIGLVLLALGGLWAFSFFLFNPFEGAYAYPIPSLIAREVDFYVARNHLRRDFAPFPRLAFLDAFEASASGKALEDLGLRRLVESWKIDDALKQLDQVLSQLPIRVDPLGLFGGEGLAVAGHFAGPTLADAQWAVYGRTSWLGKLAVELVARGWVDLAKQGLTLKPLEKDGAPIGVEIQGGQLAHPVFLARIDDVVIVASSAEPLTAAHVFVGTLGRDSLYQSGKYLDHIVSGKHAEDPLEIYLDQHKLSESLKLPPGLPSPNSPDLGTALAGRVFQLGTLREVIGTTDFARTVTLELEGELTSNTLTPFQQRLYEQRGFEKDQALEAASLATADAGAFLYLHADIGDLLRELRSVVGASDPAAIQNLEDFVRQTWNYSDLDPLIDDVDAAFRDRVAFFARNYDYPPESGTNVPPHDDAPVYAWALVLWPQDQAKINSLQEVFKRKDVQEMLKLMGAEPGSNGVWENQAQGGAKITEYWNVMIPGTGHIATLEMKGREPYFVITNENRMLGHIFEVYTTGATEEGVTRLSEDPAFRTWVTNGLPVANLLAWLAPTAVAKSTRRIAERQAAENGADLIDWTSERPRIEKEVLARSFPGEKWGQVSAKNQGPFELMVQQEVDKYQASYLEQHLPEMHASTERWLAACGALKNSFFELASDRKHLRLEARLGLGFLPDN